MPLVALHALRVLLVAFAFALPGASAGAATPLPVAQPATLAVALAHYESGRFGAARRVLVVLARQGLPAAQYNLAVMHLRREVPQPSRAQAAALMERAARSGFVTAQFMLGQALENGDLGPRDLARAHDWYERAAEAGSVDAQVAMGTACFLGRGRQRDAACAAHWYREAAKGGEVGAMYLLASLYEQGDGVTQDLRLARYWYTLAAEHGDVAAPLKVKELDLREAASLAGPEAQAEPKARQTPTAPL